MPGIEGQSQWFYRWPQEAGCQREKDNERLPGLIKQSWLESGCVYGSPRIHADLREWGAPNRLQQVFTADPDQCWLTDITCIRTYEGCLYLAVVVDLFSRQVMGWSMSARLEKDIVLNALINAGMETTP